MSTQNICFRGELRKMCTLILLIWSCGHGSNHYALCKKTWAYVVTGKISIFSHFILLNRNRLCIHIRTLFIFSSQNLILTLKAPVTTAADNIHMKPLNNFFFSLKLLGTNNVDPAEFELDEKHF